MRSLLRPTHLFLLLTYLALSAVPFAPLLFGNPVYDRWQIAGIEFLAWAVTWAVFKRPALFHWLLLPAFFALPIELYLNAYYGQGISTHHLGIIVETSPKEAAEFLGNKVWALLGVAIGIVLWWGIGWRVAWRTRAFDWSHRSRWAALALLAVVGAVWDYGLQFGIAPKPRQHASASIAKPVAKAVSASGIVKVAASASAGSDDEDDAEDDDDDASASAGHAGKSSGMPPLPAWAGLKFDAEPFGQTWPFGLSVRVYNFWKERDYLAQLSVKNRLFKFGAHQDGNAQQPQVVVMVIGESSRYDRWSLNGYPRDTNPLLEKESNLVSLANVVTAVSATRLSVPVILTRKPATQSLQAGFSEKSFLTAFKEAGFKTWWLSNQMSFGEFDTPISVFAKEADVVDFMNLGGYTNQSSFDKILLTPLQNALADPAPKKLIVLHTLGSHWNYSHRYPQAFDKWKPSLFGVENPAYTDTKLKPQLNNSYDNSILYTDWFLSQVIDTLKADTPLASMIYVADHGQTLYDGNCNLAFHGHNTDYEFHVPALVWYSDAYKDTYPAKVEQLLHNRKARLATENMFHTLLDMADIRYPTERLEWSFLSKEFKPHKRYVDSFGWSDYDHSTLKGDCHEVIDKGKPLVQEK